MNAAVRAQWLAFNAPLEGRVTWMYLDIKGLVTTGEGQLIDPAGIAQDMNWNRPDGSLASRAEVLYEWLTVKNNHALAHDGATAAEHVTALRLPESVLDADALDRLDRFARILAAYPPFAAFDTWPADAQLGVLSMAWAMGPGFPRTWPKFSAACMAEYWWAAAKNCEMDASQNPGLAARNVANVAAFERAAAVA
jgi:hypothetical protein